MSEMEEGGGEEGRAREDDGGMWRAMRQQLDRCVAVYCSVW